MESVSLSFEGLLKLTPTGGSGPHSGCRPRSAADGRPRPQLRRRMVNMLPARAACA